MLPGAISVADVQQHLRSVQDGPVPSVGHPEHESRSPYLS